MRPAHSGEGITNTPSGNSDQASVLPEGSSLFKEILSSHLFLVVTGLSALAYLSFFKYLDVASGAPTMAAPSYFVFFYSLIAISSALMGLSVYSIRSAPARNTVKSNVTSGSSSTATSVSGSVISCTCHTSLLLPLFSFVGLSTISGIGIITAFVEFQLWILIASIIINLYLGYRLLVKIQNRAN